MKDRILEIIAEQFNVKVEDLDEDTNFVDDLNVDSIELLELVMTIEDEFDLELEDEVLENLTTVGDVIDYIDAQDLDE
ncbi:MAG: acyl carrier protein [Peptoniphilus sp. oral taxon 375]|uniref:acyl carrier protein n=1 Tax=Urinicoccus timonensis TaxID=2024205 RepID=UPI00021A2C09|nr:acyl carrier protein [Urinicoccus timonensis]EGS31382.1 acyl carrier protein [Peptoniphilus sp. oral taxon 375 str. F0436]MBS4871269.1 acyl carrier protein [Peptoniphilus sp. oral taxon 375]